MGGVGATETEPGDCGGAGNRLIISIDTALHAALVAANANAGAPGPGGVFDLADIPPDGFWRNSEDLAGPHEPFDMSDETEDGAPRGQAHFFRNPASPAATSPLGLTDLEKLVDPYALEIDQDYDCFHNSNPSCEYTLYGPLCAPESAAIGADIYAANYGDYGRDYRPAGCP
jgi:hypothetical protein